LERTLEQKASTFAKKEKVIQIGVCIILETSLLSERTIEKKKYAEPQF